MSCQRQAPKVSITSRRSRELSSRKATSPIKSTLRRVASGRLLLGLRNYTQATRLAPDRPPRITEAGMSMTGTTTLMVEPARRSRRVNVKLEPIVISRRSRMAKPASSDPITLPLRKWWVHWRTVASRSTGIPLVAGSQHRRGPDHRVLDLRQPEPVAKAVHKREA